MNVCFPVGWKRLNCFKEIVEERGLWSIGVGQKTDIEREE